MRTGCIHYSATMIEKLKDMDPEVYISNNASGLFPTSSHKIPTYFGLISFIISTFFAIPLLFIFVVVRKMSQPASERYFTPLTFYFPSFHPWNYFLCIYASLFKIKTIQTIHDFDYHTGEDNWILKILKHKTIQIADQIVFLTETEKNRSTKKFPFVEQKSMVLDHPSLVWPGLKNNELSFQKNPKLLMIGRMNLYKGLDLFLEALHPIMDKFESITVAGKFAKNNVVPKVDGIEFIDKYLSEQEIAKLLANNHILILPYKEATQSGIIPLGIQVGIPMVITDVGGLKSQIPDDAAVFVPADADNIQFGILSLIDKEKYSEVKSQLKAYKTSFDRDWESQLEDFKDSIF